MIPEFPALAVILLDPVLDVAATPAYPPDFLATQQQLTADLTHRTVVFDNLGEISHIIDSCIHSHPSPLCQLACWRSGWPGIHEQGRSWPSCQAAPAATPV